MITVHMFAVLVDYGCEYLRLHPTLCESAIHDEKLKKPLPLRLLL